MSRLFARGCRLLIAAVLASSATASVSAQGPPVVSKAAPTPDPKAKESATPRVTTAHLPGKEPTDPVELSEDIVVEVANLDSLLAKAAAGTPSKKIVLFLDGRPLKDLTPYPPTDPTKSQLRYQLKRTEASRDVWTHLLGRPSWGIKAVPVSVGFEDGYPIDSDATIQLRAVPVTAFWLWFAVLVGLVAAFWALARQSNILREPGPEPKDGKRRPYSLSRMQAAWWFFLVLTSYLCIGAITGDFSTSITSTVLILTGISAGTVVGAAVIDSSQPTPPPGGSVAPVASAAVPVCQAWWYDILNDPPNGVGFHRFQNAAWTVVLGIVFVSQVYTGLAMPTFDTTLLALMGISSGTYLGLKTTERKP